MKSPVLFTGTGQAKALDLYKKALTFFVKADSPLGQGNVYKSMGDIHLGTGNEAKSLDLYEKALTFFVKAGEPLGQGNVYLSMGGIYLNKGNNTMSLELYENALPFYVKVDSPLGQGNVYRGIADIHRNSGNAAKALKFFDLSLTLYRKMGAIESQAYTLMKKSSLLALSGKKDEAATLYDEALTLLEQVRRQAGLDDLKKGFQDKVYDHYETATLFMINNNYRDKAFRYAESMKARLFLDQLAEGRINLEKGIAPELKKQRDNLEIELSRLNTKLQSILKEKDAAKEKTNREEYRKREAELAELKQRIRLKNPLYAQVEYPQPVNVATLRDKVLRPDEVILEYLVTKEGVFCFVVSKDVYDIIKLPITRDELEKNVKSVTGYVRDDRNVRGGNRRIKLQAVQQSSSRLYDTLIAPLGKQTANKTIIIVPDGILASLPFEMLQTGSGYAIEKHTFTYIQSASVMEMLRIHYKKSGATGFIGFGDPVYDYDNFKTGKPEQGTDGLKGKKVATAVDLTRSGYLRNGGILDRLPWSGREVESIAGMFTAKGQRVDRHLRLDAREELVKSGDMERYGYIHYSAHGILDERMQAIALSQIPDAKEDGFLTLGEIMNSRYNARMVVLSACQTGEGKMERGEGVTGLTRAVMYAGTPAAVVSLWSVSDAGTQDLMVRLYSGLLKEGKTPVHALRQAKLEMLREGEFKSPFFWAAFVLYGE